MGDIGINHAPSHLGTPDPPNRSRRSHPRRIHRPELKPAHAKLRRTVEALLRRLLRYLRQPHRKAFSQIVRSQGSFRRPRTISTSDNPVECAVDDFGAPVGRVKCKMCGRVVDPDVAMCEGGHIVNQELYLTAMAEQENVKRRSEA